MVRQHWHVITISCPANCRFLALAVGPGNAMHPYVVQRLVLHLHCWFWRKFKLQYSFVKRLRALTGLLPFNLKTKTKRPFSIDLGEEKNTPATQHELDDRQGLWWLLIFSRPSPNDPRCYITHYPDRQPVCQNTRTSSLVLVSEIFTQRSSAMTLQQLTMGSLHPDTVTTSAATRIKKLNEKETQRLQRRDL